MARERKSGGNQLPKDHWEKNQGDLEGCKMKYTPTEMGNPEELSKSNRDLVNYVKKHKMKY
jgi:hypothetical protein